MFFLQIGMAMKEHMILLDEMTQRFWWIEDEDCNQNKLKELIGRY